jgi:UDP-N-acetyl-D-galactosamine dehydrogenase
MNSIVDKSKIKICIVGLGYVGLPLAVEFGKKFNTIGFDINRLRVDQLSKGQDVTGECTQEEIQNSVGLQITSTISDVVESNIYIVTVPTPIDKYKQPDLKPLCEASKTIANVLSEGDIVIYESTVYPGATEEVCVPILEKYSNLKFNKDFFVGYSPERINPGDKVNRIVNIKKVTSGSDLETALKVDAIYNEIIEVGTFKASSIKVAEASKIIENTQRDVMIALMNEFSIIFDRLNIETREVIEAASTKWNFVKLFPGLVGGHCISVDPYYLVHKSESVGYIPDIMKSARQINDGMSCYKADQIVKSMILDKVNLCDLRVLVLGFTFKPNCPDIRNTKVYDLIRQVESYGITVDVADPLASKEEVMDEYGIELLNDSDNIDTCKYGAVIQAVDHERFSKLNLSESTKIYHVS